MQHAASKPSSISFQALKLSTYSFHAYNFRNHFEFAIHCRILLGFSCWTMRSELLYCAQPWWLAPNKAVCQFCFFFCLHTFASRNFSCRSLFIPFNSLHKCSFLSDKRTLLSANLNSLIFYFDSSRFYLVQYMHS